MPFYLLASHAIDFAVARYYATAIDAIRRFFFFFIFRAATATLDAALPAPPLPLMRRCCCHDAAMPVALIADAITLMIRRCYADAFRCHCRAPVFAIISLSFFADGSLMAAAAACRHCRQSHATFVVTAVAAATLTLISWLILRFVDITLFRQSPIIIFSPAATPSFAASPRRHECER